MIDDDPAPERPEEEVERTGADRVVEDEDIGVIAGEIEAVGRPSAASRGNNCPGVDLRGEPPAAKNIPEDEGHRPLGIGPVEDLEELVDGGGHGGVLGCSFVSCG